jgi:Zn-finger nucleic acid-binding protein
MLECGTCDGVWLDAAEFERVCAEREIRAAVLHRSSASDRSPATQSVRYRPCLRCGKMMNRLNFGRMSGTIVDVCRGHGTFLDAGELHAVVRFIQEGGLERTRAREIEDLKDEQRRLREMQAGDVRRRADGAGEHTTLTWTAADLSHLLDWMK